MSFRRQQQINQQHQQLFENEARSSITDSVSSSLSAPLELGPGESISSTVPVSATIEYDTYTFTLLANTCL